MKKTIVAVMVAASAVLSAQAFAAGNSSNLTILGNVTDKGESCNVTPSALINGGSLTLDDVQASKLEGLAVNTPYMSLAKDIEYTITDCQKGSTDYTGNINVSVTGDYISGQDNVLTNTAVGPATNAAVTLVNTDGSRVSFTGTTAQTIDYKPSQISYMRFKAAYVKTAAGVKDGAVKGVATFTISY
ncbi:type 1 fimbrial protein [Klebsiella grimontii]|jgi:type 1 fimbria pilin|uniref:Type 1 fimbrial protein n=2 Tax=Klebsiella grimontii TaxID=2058152 RepID=A0A285AWJ7_9ENTR|nr:type 1 fimbrial protein [Klebsiella grimontii]MDU4542871.1 type 1 fimbrial protein [Klebsiella michiganensis]MBX4825181.1 type 1 fimbrial protein [Klebsiella grimontii]MBZ7225565.1 type 1 fimbrial protein [Klebsiella grimontii]MDU2773194.1 type 1 fimbrial protein [Klebsiella grimontii]MDU6355610.1 type 1 fimbrial protein [Klebsiella grimontii]